MHSRLELYRRSINVVVAALAVAGGSVAAVHVVQKTFVFRSGFTPARVLEVRAVPAVPHSASIPLVAHGTVRAGRQVDIIPQVSGELRHVHRDLAPGKIIAEGELLFEINPTVYELRVRQVEAEIQGLEATLERQKDELAGLDRRILNAEDLLAIREQDYRTSKQLRDVEDIGTQRSVDLAYQTFLRQSDMVAALEGLRALIPHTRRELEAELDAARAELRQAQYLSEQTRIACPFRARVEAVYVHESEVVTAHFAIARLTELEAFEIAVGIDLRELRWLEGISLLDLLEPGSSATGPEVQVRWSPYGQELTWRGRIARIERVDEVTQTARMIVEVRGAEMLATVAKGGYDTTGLAIGMFCTVELPGRELEGALAVPREALVDGRSVYVFERDRSSRNARNGRLRLREVPVLRTLEELVLIDSRGRCESNDCGLEAGELVVLPPLDKVVPGMRARLREERVTATWTDPSFRPANAGKTIQAARLLGAATIGVDREVWR